MRRVFVGNTALPLDPRSLEGFQRFWRALARILCDWVVVEIFGAKSKLVYCDFGQNSR